MATIVYQGLQSCLESQVLEPRTLRLRFCSPKPRCSQPLELTFKSCFVDSNTKQLEDKCHSQENSKKSADTGSWSFLEAIANGSQLGSSKEKINTTYVHPQVKRSMSSLSEKSLKLCTESLGSETGTDIIEDNIFSLSSSSSSSSSSSAGENYSFSPTREQQRPSQLVGAKKASSRSFPPPLTTISGLETLQIRPHREDGRLIIKATKAPSTRSLFQAERSQGRLRLSFYTPFYHDSEEFSQEEEIENEYLDEEEDHEEAEERELDLDEHEAEEENDAYLEEDINGNSLDVEVQKEMEKFQRPGRCKEGEPENNKGLINWESFWVATS
ncbi:protein FANTASTIC FOUR 3-like [Mangifera indica]|uniref:protein FANTASTIC FOUR 3-like n=1 Tax=Mangifera indica TaxID=29780 RepID=UPI001CFB5A9D|nr:protein FANTASTIC FOUR 3-like [Mangifera indica]